MKNERQIAQAEGLDERIQVGGVIGEAVKDLGLRGPAHPHQIDSDRPAMLRDDRQDVAPDVGPCRAAVDEQDGPPLPDLDVVQLRVQDFDETRLEGEILSADCRAHYDLQELSCFGEAPG